MPFDPGTLQSTRFRAFFQSLRELGYVDGQTIAVRGERSCYRATEKHNELATLQLTKLHLLPQTMERQAYRIGKHQVRACCAAGF